MDTLARINQVVKANRADDVTLKMGDNFNELGFDSLDRVELVMALEEEFDVTFPDELQIETVDELVNTIDGLLKK